MAIFAFSDIHAQIDLWEQIKNFIKPEDKVYCLGDVVDRGPAGLEILNEIFEMPNITLLRGNHEDFIRTILPTLKDAKDFTPLNPLFQIWLQNGAAKTIDAILRLTPSKRLKLIDKIEALPIHIKYINPKGDIIYLCHAGMNPTTTETETVNNSGLLINNLIWDRNHLSESKWAGKNNEYCVHGHTPVGAMRQFIRPAPAQIDKIFKYCEGHKINIDLGSFATHKICLLNLDTFEPIYFKSH